MLLKSYSTSLWIIVPVPNDLVENHLTKEEQEIKTQENKDNFMVMQYINCILCCKFLKSKGLTFHLI